MMRIKVFFTALTAVVILAAASILWLSKPVPEPVVSTVSPRMDPERAFANTRALCENYPMRSIVHPDNKRAAAWLQEELALLGLETGTQEFASWKGEILAESLLNVYGISRGAEKPDEIIVITSHLDIPEFVYQGAADAGADVGIILELARVFSREEHARTIVFLFTNNEEYGMQGACTFVNEFAEMDSVVAVLAMDYMNMGEMDHIFVRFAGLQKGYTPLWLRELTVAAAAVEGPVRSTDPFMEWVDRAVTIASTDTGMFLRAGYPAVNINTRAVDIEWQREIYHSREDTIEKLELATFAVYGYTAERILRSLDEMPVVPEEGMTYFKYNGRYLPGWVITALHLLLFVPFFAVLAVDFRQAGFAAGDLGRRDVLRVLFIFLAGAAGYILLKILPATPLMIRFPLYPATQKDTVLYHPQYLPVLLVLAAAVITGLILFKVVMPRVAPAGIGNVSDGAAGHRMMLFLLAILILAVWAEGSGFAAAIFFVLPAYLWPWVKPSAGLSRRLFNLLLVLVSGTVFFVFIYIFATTYQVGVMWWYILLAAAFGLFSPKVVLVFLTSAALLSVMGGIATRRDTAVNHRAATG